MNKLLFILPFIALWLSVPAQDTIYKKNAEKIVAKVLEVSPDQIKFKKFALPDGPNYIEKKSDIRLIVYSNGMKEFFDSEPEAPKKPAPLPENDYYSAKTFKEDKIEDLKNRYRYQNRVINQTKMQKILLSTNDKEIKSLVMQSREAKHFQLIGFAAIPLGITGLLVLGNGGNSNAGTDANLIGGGICIAAAVSCPIIAGIFGKKKVSLNSRAIEIYNQRY